MTIQYRVADYTNDCEQYCIWYQFAYNRRCHRPSGIFKKGAGCAVLQFRAEREYGHKDYRHFNIKTVVGANDFASMEEVLTRRYSRLLREGEELPDLIVIDGGKGQLSFACEALAKLGILENVTVVGLAKRLEEIIVPGDPYPLFLDKNSSALKLMMQIRDEAHRFGITHHRNRRSKTQIESRLRDIPGVGEKTEEALLRRFGSARRVSKATYEDLSATVGKSIAGKILRFYGREI